MNNREANLKYEADLKDKLEIVNFSIRQMMADGVANRINMLKMDIRNPESVKYHKLIDERESIEEELERHNGSVVLGDKYGLRYYLESGEKMKLPIEMQEKDPLLKKRIRYSGYRIADYERTVKNRNIRFKMKTKGSTTTFWFERGE